MESRIIAIGGNGVNYVEVGNDKPLVFIGGPCAIESEKHTMVMAEKIAEICSDLCINWIFKSCYDKDCRSSKDSFHGVGIIEGLKILSKVRDEFKIPVKYIGVGEALEDLQEFNKLEFIDSFFD